MSSLSSYCECGRRKPRRRAECCDECRRLDGCGRVSGAEVVWALRAGPQSLYAVASAVGWCVRQAMRELHELERLGVVAAREPTADDRNADAMKVWFLLDRRLLRALDEPETSPFPRLRLYGVMAGRENITVPPDDMEMSWRAAR